MKIKAKGKEYKARWIFTTVREGRMRLMIALESESAIDEIAADFDGAEAIEKTEENKPGIVERFEGFTRLLIVSRENADGLTLVTLATA